MLDGLSQDLERAARELRQLIEEEHAVMRQADFARPRLRSAAGQRRVRDRVVRRAKRASGDETGARGATLQPSVRS